MSGYNLFEISNLNNNLNKVERNFKQHHSDEALILINAVTNYSSAQPQKTQMYAWLVGLLLSYFGKV